MAHITDTSLLKHSAKHCLGPLTDEYMDVLDCPLKDKDDVP